MSVPSAAYKQGWEFALSLFARLLKIAHFNKRPTAIRSRCSLQKSDRERFALQKKSNVSDSLVIQANLSQKRAIRSKNLYFGMFLTVFSPFYAE